LAASQKFGGEREGIGTEIAAEMRRPRFAQRRQQAFDLAMFAIGLLGHERAPRAREGFIATRSVSELPS
jgi:hypothetical protein